MSLSMPLAATVAAIASAILVPLWRYWALRAGQLDEANGRSSHSGAVPRGAGIVIALVFATAWGVLAFDGRPQWHYLPVLAVAVLGALDDRFQLSARLRFATMTVLVLMALWLLPAQSPLKTQLTAQLWLLPLYAIAMLWLINLYNFMDGINGLAGFEAMFVLSATLALCSVSPAEQLLSVVMMGAVAGFLLWNFPRARVFMGDAGSTFLGATVAVLALQLEIIELVVMLILLGVFIVDSTLTLLLRIARGEHPARAHRSHAYQILSRRLASHSRAVAVLMAINLLWLLPLAAACSQAPDHAWYLLPLAYAPLAAGFAVLGAGRDNG